MWAMGLRPVYLQGALRRALDWGLVAIEPSSPLTLAPVAPARPAARPRKSVRRAVRRPARKRSRTANTPRKLRRTQPSAVGFARVGGMDDLKKQIRRIVETVYVRQEDARRYGVVRTGVLVHGPPGCGKTFFAQATAEEFGLHLLRVPLEGANRIPRPSPAQRRSCRSQ